ncbi:hypothetical protein SAMN05421595_0719 [Austwickia chelonae]|uniref:Uncharacterized protein n=1 Tax=Austwickia chelonae NBRC 105200 TaxID=1184607 RepID=K6W8Q3_9MICO|nr:hypothetical protein [Austwickia chelonae]GAB78202.1 hypothetical protein AUCHE_08_04470 [Austwickia chelonae NBRC 105200]SEV98650.1 hypothetical protein SAMN05421595_0719 [Austwickia chelonae]
MFISFPASSTITDVSSTFTKGESPYRATLFGIGPKGGWKNFAKCTLKSVLLFGLSRFWAGIEVASMASQKAYKAIGAHVGRCAAKYDFKEVAKITPIGFAATIAGFAAACALWG